MHTIRPAQPDHTSRLVAPVAQSHLPPCPAVCPATAPSDLCPPAVPGSADLDVPRAFANSSATFPPDIAPTPCPACPACPACPDCRARRSALRRASSSCSSAVDLGGFCIAGSGGEPRIVSSEEHKPMVGRVEREEFRGSGGESQERARTPTCVDSYGGQMISLYWYGSARVEGDSTVSSDSSYGHTG